MISTRTFSFALLALAACNPPPASPQKPTAPTAQPASAQPSGSMMRLDPNHVVAEWNGQKLTYGELMTKKDSVFKKIHNKYLGELHQAEAREIEGYVIEELVTNAAKAQGKTPEQYIQGLAPAQPDVSDAEIQAFYDQQGKQSGQPLEAIKDRIKGFLAQNKQREAVKAAIDKMKADAKFKLDLPPPAAAKVSFDLTGRPSKGPADAKVTMVEFSDFQCPYCSRAVPGVEAILKAYPNDVRVVFLHYPLDFHDEAMPSAIAAQCANLQGKFWEYHDKLFAGQSSLGAESYLAWAKELGLDEGKFKACIADPATKAFVQKDYEMGTAAGVEGTPSFFLNGVQTSGGVPGIEQIKPLL